MKTDHVQFNGRDVVMLETQTPFERMRGLLGRTGLLADEAMLFRNCGAIHTFGMKFPINVYFTDKDLNVVKTIRNVRPGRVVFGGFRAVHTVETAVL